MCWCSWLWTGPQPWLTSSHWLGHLPKPHLAPLQGLLESSLIVWSYSGGQPLCGLTFPLKKCQTFLFIYQTNIWSPQNSKMKQTLKFVDFNLFWMYSMLHKFGKIWRFDSYWHQLWWIKSRHYTQTKILNKQNKANIFHNLLPAQKDKVCREMQEGPICAEVLLGIGMECRKLQWSRQPKRGCQCTDWSLCSSVCLWLK